MLSLTRNSCPKIFIGLFPKMHTKEELVGQTIGPISEAEIESLPDNTVILPSSATYSSCPSLLASTVAWSYLNGFVTDCDPALYPIIV